MPNFGDTLLALQKRERLKGFQIGWQKRAQDGAAVIPQSTERPAQPIERDERFVTVLAGAALQLHFQREENSPEKSSDLLPSDRTDP